MKTYIAATSEKILVNFALIQTVYGLQCNLKLYNFIRDSIFEYITALNRLLVRAFSTKQILFCVV